MCSIIRSSEIVLALGVVCVCVCSIIKSNIEIEIM